MKRETRIVRETKFGGFSYKKRGERKTRFKVEKSKEITNENMFAIHELIRDKSSGIYACGLVCP